MYVTGKNDSSSRFCAQLRTATLIFHNTVGEQSLWIIHTISQIDLVCFWNCLWFRLWSGTNGSAASTHSLAVSQVLSDFLSPYRAIRTRSHTILGRSTQTFLLPEKSGFNSVFSLCSEQGWKNSGNHFQAVQSCKEAE